LELNLLDIIFVGLVAGFALLGATRSALRELLSLLGLVAGFAVGGRYYTPLADELARFIPDWQLAALVAFLGIVVAGYAIGVFLGSLGESMPGRTISPVSRLLGAVVGAVKGGVACLVLYWTIEAFIPAFQDELADSRIGEDVARVLAYLADFNLI